MDLLLTCFWRQEFLLEFHFQTSRSNQWNLVIQLNGFGKILILIPDQVYVTLVMSVGDKIWTRMLGPGHQWGH